MSSVFLVICNVYPRVLRPEIVVLPRLSEGILRGRQTLLRNWVIIKVAFRFTGKQAVDRRLVEMGFAPPAMERYFSGPSLVFSFRKCMAMLMIKELIIFRGFRNTGREKGSSWKQG